MADVIADSSVKHNEKYAFKTYEVLCHILVSVVVCTISVLCQQSQLKSLIIVGYPINPSFT